MLSRMSKLHGASQFLYVHNNLAVALPVLADPLRHMVGEGTINVSLNISITVITCACKLQGRDDPGLDKVKEHKVNCLGIALRRHTDLSLDTVGLLVKLDRLMDSVIAISANVILGSVSGGQVRLVKETPELKTLLVLILLISLKHSLHGWSWECLLRHSQEPNISTILCQDPSGAVQEIDNFGS